jgi:hypothetical protein
MTPLVTFLAGCVTGLAAWPLGRWLWNKLTDSTDL